MRHVNKWRPPNKHNVLVKRRRQASGGGAQRRNELERFVMIFGRDHADKVLHTIVSPFQAALLIAWHPPMLLADSQR